MWDKLPTCDPEPFFGSVLSCLAFQTYKHLQFVFYNYDSKIIILSRFVLCIDRVIRTVYSYRNEMEGYEGMGNGHLLMVALYCQGKMNGTQIKNYVKNYNTAVNTARSLEYAGLIKITITKKHRIVHYYELTEKGKRVAELFAQADDIINS